MVRTPLLVILLSFQPCDGRGDRYVGENWAPDAGARDAGAQEGSVPEAPGPHRDWLAWVEASQEGSTEILRAAMIRDGVEPTTFEVARSGESEVLDFSFVPAANALTYLSHPPGGLGAVSVVNFTSSGIGEALVLDSGSIALLGKASTNTVAGAMIALVGAASEPERSWIDIYDLHDVTAPPLHIEPGETVGFRGPASGFSSRGFSFLFGIDRVRHATFMPLQVNDLYEGKVVSAEQVRRMPDRENLVFTDGVSTFVKNPLLPQAEVRLLVDSATGPFAASNQGLIAVVVGAAPPSLAMFQGDTRVTTIAAPSSDIQAIKWIEWLDWNLFMQAVQADGVHAWHLTIGYDGSFQNAVDLGVIPGVSSETASRPLLKSRSADSHWAAYLDGAANSGLYLLNSVTGARLRVSAATERVSGAWIASNGRWLLFTATAEVPGSLSRLFGVKLEGDKLSIPIPVQLGPDLSVEDVVLSAHGDYACVLTNQASYVFDLRGGALVPGLQIEGRAYKVAWSF